MTAGRMPIGAFIAPREGFETALRNVAEMGIRTAQIITPGPKATAERAAEVKAILDRVGVAATLVFGSYPGETYESIAAVRQKNGLVPAATRAERTELCKAVAEFARGVGAEGIGIHIGFVPEEPDSPALDDVVAAVRAVADHCAGIGLTMNLETGQETGETLLRLLRAVDRPNLRVNFDPANMILYGSGPPLEALRLVGDYVGSCHCKDATWSDKPRVEWGEEVPLGTGEVDVRAFVALLDEFGYSGPLTIEREISGRRQMDDIRAAADLLRGIKKDLGIE